jgi:hypothetical protein
MEEKKVMVGKLVSRETYHKVACLGKRAELQGVQKHRKVGRFQNVHLSGVVQVTVGCSM